MTTAEWDRVKVEKKIFKGYKQPGMSLPRDVPVDSMAAAARAIGLLRKAWIAHSLWMIKLLRAAGGCLGARSRRRARRTAIDHGEQRACEEPWVPE